MKFLNTVNNDIQPTKRIGAKAASNNIKNILDLLRKGDNDDLDIPCYAIRVPTEVPCVPAVTYYRLAVKVNSSEQMLKAMSSKMASYETNFPSLSSHNDENYATVIIS